MTELIASWKEEEQAPFAGWDFSYLDGRMLEDQAPWSYTTRAKELMGQAQSVLDLDTGGGERLLNMREAWPAKVVATETYPPNLQLARERLEPLGVTVLDVENNELKPLPFGNAEFDLILDRHAAINVDEVARMLTPGGTFLTQQVHGMWAHDLLAAFGATPQWPDATPARYVPWLERVGMEIVMHEDWEGELAFIDVGAIVYYLKAVPWLVPGFSVEMHTENLLALQRRLEVEGKLVFVAKKYMIEAQKPLR
ncbi:MAG: class I SAM-dependent methyltransferase [Caldilineaceae bacterium]|nr:class I SAM-dependent methyltransferase [Caldilineaceae bacterium]